MTQETEERYIVFKSENVNEEHRKKLQKLSMKTASMQN